MSDEDQQSVKMREIMARLHRDADIQLAQVCGELQQTVGSYAQVQQVELVTSLHGILDQCLGALRSGRPPSPAEFAEAQVIRRRFEQGIHIEDVLLAFRTSFRAIRSWIMETAGESGLGPDETVGWITLLWDVESAGETQFGAISRTIAREDGRRAELERADFVRELLLVPSSSQRRQFRVNRDLHRYLQPGHRYRILIARVPNIDPAVAIESLVKVNRHRGIVPQLIVHEGDVVGVVPRRPDSVEPGVLAAVSEPLLFEKISDNFSLTRRILEAAHSLGLDGIHDLHTLGMLLAVAEQSELGALFHGRYIEPLLTLGPFGHVIVETLEALVHAEFDLGAAAEALFVHINTVRHRIRKAESTWGFELRHLHSRELWWAVSVWRSQSSRS